MNTTGSMSSEGPFRGRSRHRCALPSARVNGREGSTGEECRAAGMSVSFARRPWKPRLSRKPLISPVQKDLSLAVGGAISPERSAPVRPRGPDRKADDIARLAELRPTIDQRSTYGYRRVTPLRNRQRGKPGTPAPWASGFSGSYRRTATLQKHSTLQAPPHRTLDGSSLQGAPISAGAPNI